MPVESKRALQRRSLKERRLEPSAERIAQRAFEIYLARGGEHGYDVDDWLMAERELRRAVRGEGAKSHS